MHVIINIAKVAYGLTIVGVCVIGLIVICKHDTREEKRNARLQRSYLYLDSHRNAPDD